MATKIKDLMDAVLLPRGFKRARSGLAYSREQDGAVHRVAGRKSRHGGPERDIHFQFVLDGEEAPDSHGLSPVAPLKNTYWWQDELPPEEVEALAPQLEQIALPFFHAMTAGFDRDEARSRVLGELDALTDATPPFVREGTCWWRQRGPIIDMVDVEFLAEGVFAQVYASVWHTSLAAGIDGPPPDRVTRVTATTLSLDGPEAPPHSALFCLGPPHEGARSFDGAAVVALALARFDRVHSVDDVKAMVQPVYRPYMDLG
jgi:hypothetical protein